MCTLRIPNTRTDPPPSPKSGSASMRFTDPPSIGGGIFICVIGLILLVMGIWGLWLLIR